MSWPAANKASPWLSGSAVAGYGQDFCRAIIDDREPAVTGRDGRQAVEMAIAADISAATGEAVKIPLSGSQTAYGERQMQTA